MELEIEKKIKVNAKKLNVFIKVRDQFSATLYDEQGTEICDKDEIYVPSFMPGDHHGDYLDLQIDIDTGQILNWKRPTAEQLSEFINAE